jgi:hypothetical protein
MYYPHTYCHIQLLVVCNLFYATMGFSNCMCCIQLKISCIRQLQNDNFILVKVMKHQRIYYNKKEGQLQTKRCFIHYNIRLLNWNTIRFT